jgi:hypothetical protein
LAGCARHRTNIRTVSGEMSSHLLLTRYRLIRPGAKFRSRFGRAQFRDSQNLPRSGGSRFQLSVRYCFG